MVKLIAFVLFNFLALSSVSCEVEVPKNPCPEIFEYEVLPDSVKGLVTIPFEGLPIFLEVEASMKGIYQKHKSEMLLELLTETSELLFGTAKVVKYRIHFPVKTSIPQITKIILNSKEICKGPKLVPNIFHPEITKLKAYRKIYTTSDDEPETD